MNNSSQNKRSFFSWIMEWASGKRFMYILSIVFAIACVALRMMPYVAVGEIVKALLNGEKESSFYLHYIFLMFLYFLFAEIAHSLSTSLSHVATFEVLRNLRKTLLDKLVRIPLGRVESLGTGSLKSTMMERVDSIETTLAHLLPEFTANLLLPIVLFIFLFRIDWRMALLSFVGPALGMVSAIGLYSGYDTSYQRVLNANKILNATALEYVDGIEVIKGFGQSDRSYDNFAKAAKECAGATIAWMKRCAFYQAATLTLLPYTLLAVLPLGAYFVYNSSLNMNDYIMCLILSIGLLTPLVTLGSYTDDMAKVSTVVGEVSAILDEAEINHPDISKNKPADNSVSLNNVSFAYEDKEVLKDINLTFKAGTVNALVGPSGSGKSTIARLIAGYWPLEKGKISIGGIDEKDLSFADLRQYIAYVSQDDYLFNDTVRNNIRQGRIDATDEEVEEVARKSGCYDFIMSLENGFDTIVGSKGGHLSGGERQRISIARAMMKDASIIILDEATAYTDPENEAIIEKAIGKLVKGKTLIMIAHRLYTIVDADEIYLINEGKLEAHGTQTELLASSPLYQKMWESHINSRDREGAVA